MTIMFGSDRCDACKGSGISPWGGKCKTCDGLGYIPPSWADPTSSRAPDSPPLRAETPEAIPQATPDHGIAQRPPSAPTGDNGEVPDFDGRTYSHERDHDRLARQHRLVYNAMSDHEWHTLAELSDGIDEPEASISARLRDLRKQKFGGHTVERRYVADGLWEYRLLPKGVEPF